MDEFFTIHALAKKLARDRRTIERIVANVPPAKEEAGRKLYSLAAVMEAIANKPGKTLRDEKLIEEIENWRIRNKKLRGELLDESKESAWLYSIAKETKRLLWQKLVNELPAEIPKEEPEARDYAKRIFNTIMLGWREIVRDENQRKLLADDPAPTD